MNTTAHEVLGFVQENDIKFVRLGFCDILGQQKNISIMADELPFAFAYGVSFDAHAIKGFRDVTRSDLLLFPDPATLTVLPWRPGPGRVARFYCDIKNPDGSAFSHDGRILLKRAIEQVESKGYLCKIGSECEFYLFRTDENGEVTNATLDRGGYLDISPLDRGEDMRREICLTLEEMGLRPKTSHHEQGPGQNEIVFASNDPLTCADNLQTFKSVVRAIAMRNGLFASFMPKPLPNTAGSGLHINLSLAQNGTNIFQDIGEGRSKVAESFIAGVLDKAREMTLFLNPLANSYDRFGEFEAPRYVSWSHHNRSQLLRIPAAIEEKSRMELRSPDPATNPYLAFALVIAAGLRGIEQDMTLPAACDHDLYTADAGIVDKLDVLPESLDEAIACTEGSAFVAQIVGEELLANYLALKKTEATEFKATGNKTVFYQERYFGVV
ncbi:MAG: glutamine synthetase family protein [Coriobacteriia bacterium]|nr:glutamine synthetase family protein [Coriobacteriia bacterium]